MHHNLTSSVMSNNIFINNELKPRIIGGSNVPRGKYPWFSATCGCGGSLVAPEFILTAAHCHDNFQSKVYISALCPYTIKGSTCEMNNVNCGQDYENIGIEQQFIHPEYDQDRLWNDVMLLKLKRPSTVPPVDMDLESIVSNYTSKTSLTVIGMGDTDPSPNNYHFATHLQQVTVNYVPKCKKIYSEENIYISNDMMCAVGDGKDSCIGDSGGPLYDTENEVIVGLVSWGFGCDGSYPGVYSNISTNSKWIKETICENSAFENRPSFCPQIENPNSSSRLHHTRCCDGCINSIVLIYVWVIFHIMCM